MRHHMMFQLIQSKFCFNKKDKDVPGVCTHHQAVVMTEEAQSLKLRKDFILWPLKIKT